MPALSPAVAAWTQAARLAAAVYQIPPSWILATIQLESHGDANAVSFTGYRGLMQVGKDVADGWAEAERVPSPWPEVMDPSTNLAIGAHFLAWCSKRVRGWCPAKHPDHPAWVRACYGWGPGNLAKAVTDARSELDGRTPTFDELATLNPSAGANPAGGWYVRPWTGGRRYRDLVAAIEAEGLPAQPAPAEAGGWATWAVLGLLAAAGIILAAAGFAAVAK